MKYDVVIVGGGIAGLTAAAFLSKEGAKVVLCEKESKVGGLVNSFDYKGFLFDGGIRAIENSGIVLPMLAQLGLKVDFLQNDVSIGIENEVIRIVSRDSLADYQKLLSNQFPEQNTDIESIIGEIRKMTDYMDILHGIDNPAFLDFKKNRKYLFHTFLPWHLKYLKAIKKIENLQIPVDDYLKRFTKNQALIDMILQPFPKKTSACFALSCFSLYLDYKYPKGGTGDIIKTMEDYILKTHGEIKKGTSIATIHPQAKIATDKAGNEYHYRKLIWTSDMKAFYESLDSSSFPDEKTRKRIQDKKALLSDKTGGDSILTVFVTLDSDKSYFEKICSAHLFYTPDKKGLSIYPLTDLGIPYPPKETIINWVRRYYELTTYEISCPVMRDDALAPEGKTGLMISTRMDCSLVRHISETGWYDEFKDISQECILTVLNSTIFPGIGDHVMDCFASTPLTIEKMTGNSDGAITGWSFTNDSVPTANNLKKIVRAIQTPVPDIYQAGQWTFSPSGFPISILTAKYAADQVIKELKKEFLI